MVCVLRSRSGMGPDAGCLIFLSHDCFLWFSCHSRFRLLLLLASASNLLLLPFLLRITASH